MCETSKLFTFGNIYVRSIITKTCDEIQKSAVCGKSFEDQKHQYPSIQICPDNSPPTYSSIIKQRNGK